MDIVWTSRGHIEIEIEYRDKITTLLARYCTEKDDRHGSIPESFKSKQEFPESSEGTLGVTSWSQTRNPGSPTPSRPGLCPIMIQNSIIHVMLPPLRRYGVSNNLQPAPSLGNCRFDVIPLIATVCPYCITTFSLSCSINHYKSAIAFTTLLFAVISANLNTIAGFHHSILPL